MKKHFLVHDAHETYGVFEYTNDEQANESIKEMVLETLCADSVILSENFTLQNYQYKPIQMIATPSDEAGDSIGEYFLRIEQIGVYNSETEEVLKAKETLKKHGYFVDNLWQLEDVKSDFECSNEQAYEVLRYVLEGKIESINEAIKEEAEDTFNLNRKPLVS